MRPADALRLAVDADVARALLPPREFYEEPAWLAALRAPLFARAWHPLDAAAGSLARGAARPATLLPPAFDEPLLLTRDEAGALRLMSNACTHRGHLVVEQPCAVKALRCAYHGRRFDLAGKCLGAPGFEEAKAFPRPEDSLATAQVGEWRGLLFGSLAPRVPLAQAFAEVDERVGALVPAQWTPAPQHDRTFEFDANWALYVENYLEGLHIPFIHPGLTAKLDWKSYRYENLANGTLQVGIAAPDELAFELPAVQRDAGARVAAFYFCLFPNLMLNVYPWGLSLNVVEPLTPTRTRVRFHAFVHDAKRHGQGAGSGLDQVELEDERAVAQVQRGLRGRLWPRGRYAPVAESGVHWFHRRIASALDGTD
jgi:choline monooxygenase